MSFRQQVKVTRPRVTTPAIGNQRSDGKWIGEGTYSDVDVLYDSMGDVQDLIKRDERDQAGSPMNVANGIIYLMLENTIDDMKTDDTVEIVYESGKIENAVIVDVRRLDGSILIQRIRTKDD